MNPNKAPLTTLPATRRTLFGALVDAASAFGSKRAILVDGDGRVLTYGELQLAALALGHALKKGTRKGETVGILLPSGMVSLIDMFALSAYGRVSAMMIFTAGLNKALRRR